MKQVENKYFVVKKTQDNKKIASFEASDLDTETVIGAVINYLNINQLDFVYDLKIGDIVVRISRFCREDVVLSDYESKLNQAL